MGVKTPSMGTNYSSYTSTKQAKSSKVAQKGFLFIAGTYRRVTYCIKISYEDKLYSPIGNMRGELHVLGAFTSRGRI